jgi:hypothetical protein
LYILSKHKHLLLPVLMLLSKFLPRVSGKDMSSHYHSTNIVPASQHKYPLNLHWLEEIHSKIWSRDDLEWDLFRKVEVTQAHYAELQKRLNDQHSARDLSEYDGGQLNVRSVKLDFLRSITPLLPRHTGNNEDRVDDDDGPEASNEDGHKVGVDESETSSSHSFSVFWVCHLGASRRTCRTALLCHFSFVKNTIIFRR